MTGVEWDPYRYLDQMLAEIPSYLELQENVARGTEGLVAGEVLELGIGTGETAGRVLKRHPDAHWTAIDANEAMLERARETFPDAEVSLRRLEDPLPPGPFDLVVSSLVVHHLGAAAKQDLFRRVRDVLRPGGAFVLGDVVVPEDPADALIEIDWVVDVPDRLDDQIAWLESIGFTTETLWTERDLAVVRAVKPLPRPG